MKARTTVRAFFVMAHNSSARAKFAAIAVATCRSLSAGLLDRFGERRLGQRGDELLSWQVSWQVFSAIPVNGPIAERTVLALEVELS